MNELTTITHPDSSTETLTYDNNGNLTQTTRNSETTSYQWDCFDRLKKVTLPPQNGGTNGETVDFNYDEDGMLIKMDSEGTEQKFTQKGRFATRELVKNQNGEWETSSYHTVHGSQMLATHTNSTSRRTGGKITRTKNSNTIFYHTDHLGSVRLITDENGNIVDSSTTDAYGNPLPQADSTGNKGAKMLTEFNFVGTHGIRYVEKVRLHNMRARWYSKSIKRFMIPDPLGLKNKGEYLNRYIYSGNHPVNNIDINGLKHYHFNVRPAAASYTKKLKYKLCKIFEVIEDKLCPKLRSLFEKVDYYDFVKSSAHEAAYTPAVNEDPNLPGWPIVSEWIEVDITSFNKFNKEYLAYTFMEEFIHMKQTHNQEGWLLKLLRLIRVYPPAGSTVSANVPYPMSGDEIIDEALAKKAQWYALKSRILYNAQQEAEMIKHLTIYNPHHQDINSTNFDPYDRLLNYLANSSYNQRLPYIYKTHVTDKYTYNRYCQ